MIQGCSVRTLTQVHAAKILKNTRAITAVIVGHSWYFLSLLFHNNIKIYAAVALYGCSYCLSTHSPSVVDLVSCRNRGSAYVIAFQTN
jgi:hypothetical protein